MINKANKFISYVPAVILILGIFGLPYGYYIFLRLIVCAAAVYLAYCEYVSNQKWNNWAVIFSLIAVLFNPVVMIFLSRPIWFFIDIFCVGLFVSHFKINTKESKCS